MQLLDGITLPRLEHFAVSAREDNARTLAVLSSNTCFTAIVDLIERSRCPLQYLDYPEGAILSEDLVRLLHVAPTLTTLSLSWVGFDDEPVDLSAFLRALRDIPSGAVSPALDSLHLSGLLVFSPEEFLETIRARSQSTPFKTRRIGLDAIGPDSTRTGKTRSGCTLQGSGGISCCRINLERQN